MDEAIYINDNLKQAAHRLAAVLEGLRTVHDPTVQRTLDAKEMVIARYQPLFSPENISKLTADEFKSFLLFENNQHWWGLHRRGNFITADMDNLRKALVILVDESQPIRKRMDQLIPKSGPMVPYLGRAVLTAILLVVYSDRYGVWNATSEAGLKELDVWPKFERGASFGERYDAVNQVLLSISQAADIDLWTMDALYWKLVQTPNGTGDEDGGDGPSVEGKEAPLFGLERYLHEFMRDNWDRISHFRNWDLHEEDGEMVGYEYITTIGRIDLLARHKRESKWLVVELKRNKSSDDTVGQTLRYMGWVAEKLAQPGDEVQGLIVCHASDEKLRYALMFARNVELMLYEVDFHLRKP
jgi:hypothetical protein